MNKYLFIFKSKNNFPWVEVSTNNIKEAQEELSKLGFTVDDFYIQNILLIEYQLAISQCPMKQQRED